MNESIVDWDYLRTENEYCLPQLSSNIIVHEYFLKGKHSPQSNEDGIFVNNDFIAVADGATSKTKEPHAIKTTGRIAMEQVLETVSQFPAEITMCEAVQKLTDRLSHLVHSKQWQTTYRNQRPTSSISIFSRFHQEIWQIGDCPCHAGNFTSSNEKHIDHVMSEVRSFINQSLLLQGRTIEELQVHDIGRDAILPFLQQQILFQNLPKTSSPFAFPVIDGQPVQLDQVNVIPVRKDDQVILATDGYPQLLPTLKQSEHLLQHILTHDPLCISIHKSTKGLMHGNTSFDDRAYIRFSIY